jgi:hypothetical protein
MCIYGIFGDDFGFIVSKKGKLLDPKNIQAIINIP